MVFCPHLSTNRAGRALIYDGLGDRDAARRWARVALRAAEAKHSGLTYHPRGEHVGAWGQTEFQVNLKLGLTPRRRTPRRR